MDTSQIERIRNAIGLVPLVLRRTGPFELIAATVLLAVPFARVTGFAVWILTGADAGEGYANVAVQAPLLGLIVGGFWGIVVGVLLAAAVSTARLVRRLRRRLEPTSINEEAVERNMARISPAWHHHSLRPRLRNEATARDEGCVLGLAHQAGDLHTGIVQQPPR